jgi:hypothetical protein
MAKAKVELQVIDLDKFDINQLPELQNKKAEVAKRLKDFKYVAILDNTTYEEGKKSRTGIRSIRTELQTEQKSVNKKIKDFILEPVKNAYTELIEEVVPVENKQQEEVSRWETIKETERLAKVRAEEERVAKIREAVVNFENECNGIIQGSNAENVNDNKAKLDVIFNNEFDFMEFQQLFEMAKHRVQSSFDLKCGDIKEKENQRLENERIKAEQLDQKRVFDIKEKFSNWRTNWLTKLSTLTFEESKTVQKEFSEELALDCQEYQESYSIARAEIQSLIERTIGHLEITHKQTMQNEVVAEENRMKMEAFQKEKAEFEENKKAQEEENERKKSLETKVDETPQGLTVENFDFDKGSANSIQKVIPSQEVSEKRVDRMIEANEGGLSSMNYNDKLEILTKWLYTQDEIILDELIQKYLN